MHSSHIVVVQHLAAGLGGRVPHTFIKLTVMPARQGRWDIKTEMKLKLNVYQRGDAVVVYYIFCSKDIGYSTD